MNHDPTTLPTIAPARELDLHAVGRAVDFALSADERTAYLLTPRIEVDLWASALRFWPAAAGVLLLLALLVLAVRCVRVARRSRATRGEPFCGACGYQLTGVASAACPECGKAIDARDLARRPLLRPLRAMLVLTVAYLLSVGAARAPLLRGAADWRSGALLDYLQSRRAGVVAFLPWRVTERAYLYRVALDDAARVREVACGNWPALQYVALGGDGRSLLLRNAGEQVRVVPLDTSGCVAGEATWATPGEQADAWPTPAWGDAPPPAPGASGPWPLARLGAHWIVLDAGPPVRLLLWDERAGPVAALDLRGFVEVHEACVSADGTRLFVLAADAHGRRALLTYEPPQDDPAQPASAGGP